MKTANYETGTNKLLGWYDKDIHTTIPTPNIEVSDEVWQNAINESANYVDIEAKILSVKDFRTDAEILEQTKATKLNQIEQDYNIELTSNITYKKEVFDFDGNSITILSQNVAIGSVPDGFYWKALNSTKVPITFIELQEMATIIQTRGMTAFDTKDTRKIALYLATTIEEVDLV